MKNNNKAEIFFRSWPEIKIKFVGKEFDFDSIKVAREERGYVDDGKYSFKLTASTAACPKGFMETLQENKGKAQVVYIYQDGRDEDGNDIQITRELEYVDVNCTVVYRSTETLFDIKLTITLPGMESKEENLQKYLNRRFDTNDVFID